MAGRKRSRSLVGAAVGSGIVARAAEQGGADFLLAINAGRMRSMGAASIACMLPIHDAAQLTLDFANAEILPMTTLPVYVGINPWNLRVPPKELAKEILAAGFHGAVNFPTAMHYSRGFRRVLDQAGLGTRAEISLLQAVEAEGGRTMFFCGSPQQARDGADAGLSALLYNYGWNLGGALGHRPRQSLEEAALQAKEVSRYLKRHRKDLKLFLEGGPIAAADDLAFISELADIDGYVGGSTIDRMPIESSIGDQISSYRLAMDAVKQKPPQDRKLNKLAMAEGLVGQSQAFQTLLIGLQRAARATAPVVLHLPPGGPKRGLLRLFDRLMPKHLRGNLVEIGPGAGHPRDIELQLFGHPTQAGQTGLLRRPEVILAIPEFDALQPDLKTRLVAAISEGTYTMSGGERAVQVQARTVLLTTDDASVDGAAHVHYPGLEDRPEDLEQVLQAALTRLGASDSLVKSLGPGVRQRLKSHAWTDNEAEIERFAQALLTASDSEPLNVALVERLLASGVPEHSARVLPQSSREQLIEALSRHNFRRGDTATALNISRKTLYNRMKRFDLL